MFNLVFSLDDDNDDNDDDDDDYDDKDGDDLSDDDNDNNDDDDDAQLCSLSVCAQTRVSANSRNRGNKLQRVQFVANPNFEQIQSSAPKVVGPNIAQSFIFKPDMGKC